MAGTGAGGLSAGLCGRLAPAGMLARTTPAAPLAARDFPLEFMRAAAVRDATPREEISATERQKLRQRREGAGQGCAC